MSRLAMLTALALGSAGLTAPTTKAHYSDSRVSRNRREKATGLPPVAPHATDTSIPAVAAAIAKRERKAAKLKADTYKSAFSNQSHDCVRVTSLNPFYIAQ